jgi:enterochelin esterase-like enzyme
MKEESYFTRARAEARRRRVVSPEIHSDHRVTFRLAIANVTQVILVCRQLGHSYPLTRDADGIWNATIGPLGPGIYEYSFMVEDLLTIDPTNPEIKSARNPNTSLLTISGNPPSVYDFQNVPHGTLHQHYYDSKLVGPRAVHVYTPPGYERNRKEYPTLYLLPGSGDVESTWTVCGRAHLMLDNLVFQKRAVPMIAVMLNGEAIDRKKPRTEGNLSTEALRRDLIGDALPLIEDTYRVKQSSEGRAIFGVSRGGGQSLVIGLIHCETFSWIGGMSSGIVEHKSIMARALSDSEKVNRHVRLLWFGCGVNERPQLGMNQFLDRSLTEAAIHHEFSVLDGFHGWPLWRPSFAEFASRLFVK